MRLLGAVEADNGQQVIAHFATRTVAQLLARLALQPHRTHPREELIELLWPGVAVGVGRNRFRQTLSALKSLLEREHAPRRPVIEADRMGVRVLPGAIDCDVRLLEHLMSADRPDSARALFRGEFMPGHYEDWVVEERRRVETLHEKLSLRSARALPPVVPSGLCNYWTPAFGLEAQAERLAGCVRAHRLVTLCGAGGSGKTRLAVALADALTPGRSGLARADAASTFDRIAFVSLIDCVHPAQLLAALVSGLSAPPTGDALEAIRASLAGRSALVILDNAEQLSDEASALFVRLLSNLPALHLLATSRRLFDLDGEFSCQLGGLPLAPEGSDADTLRSNDAVCLFISRARDATARFEPDPDGLIDIAALVRWLGGMPLAIELAASRMRATTPRELLARLQAPSGSPMLEQLARRTAGDTTALRHGSMRQVVEASWDLLDATQRDLLRAISVLASPARLETLAATAHLEATEAQRVIDQLHDAHLMHSTETDGVVRHGLPQPVREFAVERTAAQADAKARDGLMRWLAEFVRRNAKGHPVAIQAEMALIEAAVVSADADRNPVGAIDLALALSTHFWDTAPASTALLDAIEPMARQLTDDARRADIHALLAHGYGTAGLMRQGLEHARMAMDLAHDDLRRSQAQCVLVSLLLVSGTAQDELQAQAEQAAALAQRCGNLRALAAALRVRATIACNVHKDFVQAEKLLGQAQDVWERLGSRRMSNARLLERAILWWGQGRQDEAMATLRECERTAVVIGDRLCLLDLAWYRSRILIRQRQWAQAISVIHEGVQICWQLHRTHQMPQMLAHLPEALVMTGRAEDAARLQAYALQGLERQSRPINAIEARELKAGRRMIRRHLGAARADALRIEGIGLSLKQAVARALA